MIKPVHILFIFLVFISTSWLACDKERDPCLQPKVTSVRIGAYVPADTGRGTAVELPSPIIGFVDTGFYFYDGTVKGQKFSMFLSSRADSCRFFVIADSTQKGIKDTLTFYYQRQPQFLSEACGYIYFYNLLQLKTTNNRIDSALIVRGDVSTDATIEHVRIYFPK